MRFLRFRLAFSSLNHNGYLAYGFLAKEVRELVNDTFASFRFQT